MAPTLALAPMLISCVRKGQNVTIRLNSPGTGRWSASLAALLVFGAGLVPAHGQNVDLETIVVTASRRETAAKATPVATTLITRKEIERRGCVRPRGRGPCAL